MRSDVAPGDVRAQLPAQPPEEPEPLSAVLSDLDRVIVPGLTQWQHPGFFGYFPAGTSGPSALAELATAGLGGQGMLWSTSPAATELETHVLDWLAELLGLPARFRGRGVIQDTASSATLCALLAARERAAAGGRELTVMASSEAHSALDKAVAVAGLEREAIVRVPVDARQRLDPAALADLLAAQDGPVFLVATAGTTSTGAFDPLDAIAAAVADRDVWLHVDGAWAGTAAVCPELRWVGEGLGAADSYVTNPHKWLLTAIDCSALWVADPTWLERALTVTPEYLRNAASDSGAVIDYRDWQIGLGRRFRALKLWFVLRLIGAEGLRAHVRRHVALAQRLAARVDDHPRLHLAAPAELALVCVTHAEGDAATQRLLEAINADPQLLVTHTRVDGRLVLRVAIGGARTTERHVDHLWQVLARAA